MDLKEKRVLVTGGAGFIGSHIVDALLEQGAKVRVIDNFDTGLHENLAHVSAQIELHEADIRDYSACVKACEGVDIVIHQAALGSVPRSMDDPATSLAVNVSGTANIFAAARAAGINRVVYASSSSVFGETETLPKREGEEGDRLSPYALSKWMNEELAEIFARCYGMSLVGLRYFNIYGPRQRPDGPYAAVVPKFFAACEAGESPVIFGDGAQSRDFTFVKDAARANLLAATADVKGAVAMNIGAGGVTTVTELADVICDVMGGKVKPSYVEERAGDIRHSQADCSRAADVIGFTAAVQLAEGLAQTKPAA